MVSYISPYNIKDVSFFFKDNKKNKLFLKQSYIMLTWFYYITFFNLNKKVSFFVFKKTKTIFNKQKSPMAQKKNSKEHFKFNFYKIKISINYFLLFLNKIKLNEFIFFYILSKKNFPCFETNLFFLKFFISIFLINDCNFFNYNKLNNFLKS